MHCPAGLWSSFIRLSTDGLVWNGAMKFRSPALLAAWLLLPATSLVSFEGESTEWRDAVFYEYYWEAAFPQTPTTFGVRTDRYKFIHYHGIWDIDELYDLQNDPDERDNLIDRPEHQGLVKKLRARLYDWLEKTDGMQIPLRREVGGKSDKRGPKATKEFKFHEDSQ